MVPDPAPSPAHPDRLDPAPRDASPAPNPHPVAPVDLADRLSPAPGAAATLPEPDPVQRRRFLVHLLWLAAVGAAADLATKSWAYAYLHDPAAPYAGEWWPGTFVLRWTLNDGALFGTLGGRNVWLLALSFVALPIIGYFFWTNPRQAWRPTLALSAILAGTIGNLYDRIVFSGVRDFLYVEAINWPIFNVADIWICVGAGLFVLEVLFAGPPRTDTKT